jgi:CelD/BcsL family acetyltransferase involved in cellulose biosynthesis
VATCPIEILQLEDALLNVGEQWRALEQQAVDASFFQSLAWAATVATWRKNAPDYTDLRDCKVLIARCRDGNIIGLWAFQIERHLSVQFATGLGDPFNQYNGVILAPDADPEMVVGSMLAALKSLGSISGAIFRKVRIDAECQRSIARRGTMLATAAAPSVDLTPFADFKEYHRTIKSKTRKNLRNARNRLTRNGGELVHVVHEGTEAVANTVKNAFALRTAWLEREGISSRAFLDAGFSRFVQQLGAAHSQNPGSDTKGIRLIAFELRQGDEMVSIQWGFIDKRRYYAFIAVRNPLFNAQSPGRLHLEDVIESCSAREIDVVDFLAPNVDYKQTWATHAVQVNDFGIAFDTRGQLVLKTVLGAPRRIAKEVFDRLPRQFRNMAIRILARNQLGA